MEIKDPLRNILGNLTTVVKLDSFSQMLQNG